MLFEKERLYHIYNQGNNRQPIFFDWENYLFFLQKMRKYLLPYCDMVAYCLMPNHFHWMVEVKEVAIELNSDSLSQRETITKPPKVRTFNDSIGLLIRSYTQAINKQQNSTGSLFRPHTKAECLTQPDGITPSFYNTGFGTQINTHCPEDEYAQVCFDYIHQNPVRARLVANTEDWEYSSFRDYCGMRNGSLINKNAAKKYGILIK